VKLAIIGDIEQGRLVPGSLIPSEAELLERFDVSRPTLVRSFQDLVREGWVYRRQGKGTFVADRTARPVEPTAPEGQIVPLFVHSQAVRQSGDAKELLIHLMRGVQTALEGAGFSLVMRSIKDMSRQEIDKFLGARSPGPALVVEPSSTPLLWEELRSRGWNAWAILDNVPDGNCVYIDQVHRSRVCRLPSGSLSVKQRLPQRGAAQWTADRVLGLSSSVGGVSTRTGRV
jgi:DNA-binding transcriptional regulator YhcF (GntR family)